MKKFYESPVVEITVFDVEDVITASVQSTNAMNTDQLDALVSDIEGTYTNTDATVSVSNFGSYTW